MKVYIGLLFLLATVGCSMPTDTTLYYSGWPLEYQLDRYEEEFGSYTYYIDYMAEYWVCHIELEDALVLLYNDTGRDTPDWQTLLVVRY